MAIKRKPAETAADKIDEFIGGATAEKSIRSTKDKPDEITDSNKTENVDNKCLQQSSTSRINMDDLIGRGSIFAATFKRETYYVHKDLVEAINEMASKGGKGEKTRIINRALQRYLEEEDMTK